MLVYGGSLQYSMPYLKSEVKDLQLPDFINHLIPIVEAQFSTPVPNNFGNSFITTGTINLSSDLGRQLFPSRPRGDDLPVNRASGTGVGVPRPSCTSISTTCSRPLSDQPLIGGTSTPVPSPTF